MEKLVVSNSPGTDFSSAVPERPATPSTNGDTHCARRCGAIPVSDSAVRWRVWAPQAQAVELMLIDGDDRRIRPMQQEQGGHFTFVEPGIPDGQQYAYRLDGGPPRPDPCSLCQPEGVHGPSAFVRTDHFTWNDGGWEGVRLEDLVFYELHVGTFTPEGTFEAIIPRLGELKQLGVTALELMPVASFPGTRNWGYDGVLPYAAQQSYGGPHGLQKLVDACHAAGLAVFLDVVYNHLGPEGNYLAQFAPYFTDHYRTPWGQAINYDGPGSDAVRDFVLDNARMWLEEFHLDGLRLDAVHAIYDLGARHLLRALQAVADDVARREGRLVHLVAESDLNDPKVLLSPVRGGHGLSAQWADDVHHAVHTYLTGERQGYYADFGEAQQLANVLNCPYLYTGQYSPARGRKHAAPPDGLAGDRFVVCLQNHDQIGNRASGDRFCTLLGRSARRRLSVSLLLLSPYLPLLFMGEEYGEENSFPFFCSFGDPALVQAVRDGRRREFKDFAWQGEVPDPQDEGTFNSAKLTWSWPEGTAQAAMRRLYTDLLAARREWPALRDFTHREARLLSGSSEEAILELVRGDRSAEGQALRAYFNLTEQVQPLPPVRDAGCAILFSSESQLYHGSRKNENGEGELLPHECLVIGPDDWRRLG